jgi:hypothetical protein
MSIRDIDVVSLARQAKFAALRRDFAALHDEFETLHRRDTAGDLDQGAHRAWRARGQHVLLMEGTTESWCRRPGRLLMLRVARAPQWGGL